jgi:hypothetical protein
LGRVVMVEVTKKVKKIPHIVFKQFHANLMIESQMGAIKAVYIYTLVAIL